MSVDVVIGGVIVKMVKPTLCGAVILLGVGTLAVVQAPDDVRAIVSGLRDANERSRGAVAGQAVALLRNGTASALLADSSFQAALLGALRDANNLSELSRTSPESVTAESGEGHSEYVAALVDLAMPVVDTLPRDQKSTWLRELLRCAYGPDSRFALWLADQGEFVLGDLLDQIGRNDRANAAYGVTAQMVASSAFGPNSHPSRAALSFEHRQAVIKILKEALDRKEVASRIVIDTFKRTPSGEAVAILQDFSRRSRGEPSFINRHGPAPSFQEHVESAIKEMQAALR